MPADIDQHTDIGPQVKLISVTLDSPGKYEKMAIEFLAGHDALDHAYMLSPDSDEQVQRGSDTWCPVA